MERILNRQKRVISYLIILIVFILMGNSNNIPETFVERVFKPIKVKESTIYYSGIITIGGLYYALMNLNKLKGNRFIKTGFRRIIVTIILLGCFESIWSHCIQFYKSFSQDLNAIYLERKETFVTFNKNDNQLLVEGSINVKNCTNKVQRFNVKVRVPSFIKEDIREEYVTIKKDYTVNPKEERELIIYEFLEGNEDSDFVGYICNSFEYVLFNEEDKTHFYSNLLENN